ncbi:hypothetical protein SELMODRAFT_431093 [Selaginella moellendorffii]|uniref:Uncharacterized protein n=1 Tax=Selaginella moellendorffii TaxID=88036 RepID=D8TBG0_SELML|nr:hypothetical protein SELMODRAFT_431093 [Selaginella moellendorffii]
MTSKKLEDQIRRFGKLRPSESNRKDNPDRQRRQDPNIPRKVNLNIPRRQDPDIPRLRNGKTTKSKNIRGTDLNSEPSSGNKTQYSGRLTLTPAATMVRISEWTPAAAAELRSVSEDNFRLLIYAPRLTWPAGRHEQSFREWVRSRGFEGLERAINNDQETHGASLLRRWKNGYVELPSGQYKITAENLREALGLPFGDLMIGSAQGRDINPRFIQNLGKYNRKDGLQISNVPDHLKPVFKFMVAALDVRKSNSSVSKTITFMYEALQFGDPIDVAAYIFQRLKKETETAVEAIAGGADQMGAETSLRPQLDRVIRMDCPAEEEIEETEEGAEDEPEESVDETPKLKGRKRAAAVAAAAAHTPVPKKKLKHTGREKERSRRHQKQGGNRREQELREAEPAEAIQLSDSREELEKKSQEERGDPKAEEVQKKPLVAGEMLSRPIKEKESEKPQELRAETRVDPETVEEYSDRLRDISAKNGQEAEARTERKGVTTSLMRRNEEPRPSSPATMFMNAIRGMEQQQGGKAAQFSPEEVAKALQADQVLLVNQEVFDRRFFGPLNAAVAEMKSAVNSAIAEMKEEVSRMATLLDGERARVLMNTTSCQKLSDEYYHMKEQLAEVQEMLVQEKATNRTLVELKLKAADEARAELEKHAEERARARELKQAEEAGITEMLQ